MKKFYYLVAGVLSMSMLASCSNEDDIAAGNQDGDKTGAYLTLTLTGANTGNSRTQVGADDTEAGKTTPINENTITKALVLLCDGDGVVQSKHETTVATVSGSDYMQTDRIKVNTGTYNVYVIANPGSVANLITEKKTDINDLKISDITADGMTGTTGFASNGNFLMFNECNGSNDTAGASITVDTENTHDNPATNQEAIKLDRLAAKIRYEENGEGVKIEAAQAKLQALQSITFDGIALINGIKTTYLQQHWGKATATATATKQYDNILLTPEVTTDNDNSFYYRWDYYSQINPNRGLELDEYKGVTDLVKDITPSPFTKGNLYCMENNSFSTKDNCFATGADLYGNTTGVLFKATATVTGCDTYNDAEGTEDAISCFYGYNGEYFATLSALAEKYTTLFASGADAAKAELQAAFAGTATGDAPKTVSDFRVKYDLHVYEGCVMYYTHYIKDQNYIAAKGEEQAAPYHSVMRNTIYNLIIDSVKGIGDDVPGGWNPDTDPTDPVDEPTYLQVRCMVNPWVLSQYHVDLQ